MIEVELPDGSIAEFPAGTSPEAMKSAISRRLSAGGVSAPSAQAAPAVPAETASQRIERLQDTGRPVEQGLASMNRGIASALGAPVDLAQEAINRPFTARPKESRTLLDRVNPFSSPFERDPDKAPPLQGALGGSESIKQGLRKLGINVDPKSYEDQTRPEQIASIGGETLGFGASMLVPGTAAVKGLAGASSAQGFAGGARRLLGPIVEQFRRSPGAFGAAEAGAVVGSSQGAAVAEGLAPDNPGERLAGELIGGVASPAGLAVRAAKAPAKGATETMKSFSRAGREETASRILQNLLVEAGENPAQVAAALRRPDIIGEGLTSGVKSGSSGLQRLEASIARDSSKFEAARERSIEDALGRVRGKIETMARSGDPEDLRRAAVARKQYFDDLLATRFNNARLAASEAAANIHGPGRAEASRRAEEALRGALSQARTAEADLWRRVPQKVGMRTDEIAPVVAEMRRRVLQEEKLPFESTFARILEKGRTTSGELITLRSRLLSESRRLRASGDFGMANISSELADGVLRQLDRLRTTDFDEARAFSAALNEKFTQTFGGDALRSAGTGGARIAPEALLDRAFSGGGPQAAVRARQLAEAGDFGGALFGSQVRNAEEEFLRSAASEVLEDGIANPAKLQTFMRRNGDALQQFPGLEQELADAKRASFLLREAEEAGKSASKIIRQKAAFSRLLDIEDATPVVGQILGGAQPSAQIGQLARLAKSSGPGATAGLRTAILDSAFERAGGVRGGSFEAMEAALKQPVRRGTESVNDILTKNGLIEKPELDRLNDLVSRAARIEADVSRKLRADELIDPPDALTDLVVRVAGARLAAPLGEGTGSSLIAASAGSRMTRRFFENFKGSRVTDVLIEAAENPKFAAKLLERPRTEKARRELARQLNLFMVNAGILYARDIDESGPPTDANP